jgi:hypothetical protein
VCALCAIRSEAHDFWPDDFGPESTSSGAPEVLLLFFLFFLLRLGATGFLRNVRLVPGEKLAPVLGLVAPAPGGPGKQAAFYTGGVWRRVLAASGKNRRGFVQVS